MTETRRRIWCEHIEPAALATHEALGALASRDIQLLAAVFPHQREGAIALVEAARERGLSIGLWPMLPDVDGRWLHASNAPLFEAWLGALLEALDARGLTPDTVALDLEPPIAHLRSMLAMRRPSLTRLRRAARPRGYPCHRRMLRRLSAIGVESLAAAIPPAALRGRSGRGWQRALGTPTELGYDAVSAMAYTSLVEGYSRGALRRDDARALLHLFASALGERPEAALSLGATGVGALGDERAYRSAQELREDVAIARACGIEDLALFELGGAIARGPLEVWLDALVTTEALKDPALLPRPTPRARAIAAAALAVGALSLTTIGA